MSAISGINTGNPAASLSATTQQASMGKEDFLKLLVAQLQNQDPMNPSDPTEFTAQLAQFSQLEQLTNVNTSLQGLASMTGQMERMSALSLMGQSVVAETEQFQFSGQPLRLGYRLEEQAEDVKLYVLSPTGSTLATLTGQPKSPGQYFVNWDGMTDYGMPAEPGSYSLVVRAVDGDEKLVKSASLIQGMVQGVDMAQGGNKVETSAGTFAMSKVQRAGGSL